MRWVGVDTQTRAKTHIPEPLPAGPSQTHRSEPRLIDLIPDPQMLKEKELYGKVAWGNERAGERIIAK
jgi:hypothetical protein